MATKVRGGGRSDNGSGPSPPPITRVTICGYKSIREPQSFEIRPLTILAGANSSGKSSVMQPLLLLKQTVSEGSDPGAILLDGPNVRCTSVNELLSRHQSSQCKDGFLVGIQIGSHGTVTTHYTKADGGFGIEQMKYEQPGKPEIAFREGMTHDEIESLVPEELKSLRSKIEPKSRWKILRRRCFLELAIGVEGEDTIQLGLSPAAPVMYHVEGMIHLPGLRGNPEPTYPVRAVGRRFPGLFQDYVASVIDKWQSGKSEALGSLNADLKRLGLSWKVEAKHVSDTRVELRVGRLPRAVVGGQNDVVSIAHVGFGVSQALPVLVALHVAVPGQLVYIEQPEIHLHPKAQVVLAQMLAGAAKRGVRVVAETHSSLLLLGVQSLVASGKLPADLVKLHWFERKSDGTTDINSADLDKAGAFGPWPEDFGTTELEAEKSYLDAAEISHLKGGDGDNDFETSGH